ncbi:MAG: hypothetical protein WAM21_03225 [Steroidobacteraceae bacterium]
MRRAEFNRSQREAVLRHLRGDDPPIGGNPEQLRHWASEQVNRGRSEQAIAQKLGWSVEDVRRAVSERSAA